MQTQINLNADMGESFGKWKIGNDAELMKIIRSLAFSEHILTAAGKRPQPFWCAGGGYGDGGSVFNRC